MTKQKFCLHKRELLPQKLSQWMGRMSTLRMGQQESPSVLLGSSPALSYWGRAKSRVGSCITVQGQKSTVRISGTDGLGKLLQRE